MFIKAHCPVCGTDLYQNIRLHALEHLHFEGEKQAYRYAIENSLVWLDTEASGLHCPCQMK
ncbi:hypothetical protein FTO70_03680 [Methanosarcina sp. KYL-1]|uniref:hypothetical protein n=1 Tax=Methanosarcina sp. KYL-1 TaxID=2602068 RepID=UPI002100EFC0|nr:hypothetical protein [Methanosarcina sp. KYL-1]MCQ1534804.1 hypothetical protein [Methanosarcina sp. KYL-1]